MNEQSLEPKETQNIEGDPIPTNIDENNHFDMYDQLKSK